MSKSNKSSLKPTGLDTTTRGAIRALTDNICAASSELDNLLYRNNERCWRALRTADFIEASMGLVPNTALAPFYEVISSSGRVLDNASRLISDLRKNARRLTAELYKIASIQEKSGEETEND